jgi:predicted nucleic acid-binding protein
MAELNHTGAPANVRERLRGIPDWLDVREVSSSTSEALADLGPGEREAIQLALQEHASLLLMDERRSHRSPPSHAGRSG